MSKRVSEVMRNQEQDLVWGKGSQKPWKQRKAKGNRMQQLEGTRDVKIAATGVRRWSSFIHSTNIFGVFSTNQALGQALGVQ